MNPADPEKLIVCLLKMRHDEIAEGVYKAVSEEHGRYMIDLWERGILWAGGPSSDYSIGVEIYTVGTIEEARKLQRDAPLYVKGVLYDDNYFEWQPKRLPPK